MFLIIYLFFLLNIELFFFNNAFLNNVLYLIAKGIIKIDLKSMFSFPKYKTLSGIYEHMQSKWLILPQLNLANRVFFCIKKQVNLIEI